MHNHSEEIVRQPESKNLRAGKVTLHAGQEVGEHIPFRREEIVIITKGAGTVVIEGEHRHVKAGDAVFIAENKKHNIINDSDADLEYVYVVSIFS